MGADGVFAFSLFGLSMGARMIPIIRCDMVYVGIQICFFKGVLLGSDRHNYYFYHGGSFFLCRIF